MTKLFDREEVGLYPKDVNIPMAIEGGLENSNLFITNFQGAADLNYQINYAFNNDAYMYVFGDKLSMNRITGVGFPKKTCSNAGMDSTPKEFIKFYNKYKLGESNQPLRITIGGMTLVGYFVNLSINLVAAKQNTFTFTFAFLGRVK